LLPEIPLQQAVYKTIETAKMFKAIRVKLLPQALELASKRLPKKLLSTIALAAMLILKAFLSFSVLDPSVNKLLVAHHDPSV
jgi:hypothetical protein